ncbi:hypothetical protein FACS1894130_06100 [Spirochaetia bacterium]|nr:hypothetical protein FACS1894130_06100 [Spirochaetia bacterium]
MKNLFIVTLALCALSGGSLFAHEWFAAPAETKVYKTGDTVPIAVYSTHLLIAGQNIQDPARNAFFVLQNNRLVDVKATVSRNDAQKVLLGQFTLPNGAPTVVLVNNIGRFSNVTPLGNFTAAKATVSVLGVNIVKTTYSDRWCKVYINPDSQDRTFAQPLGLPLEIVPVTNPADMAAGRNAVFKVLLRGRPLRDAEVSATYKGFNSRDEEAWAVNSLKTDASGTVTIPIPAVSAAKDIWIVKVGYTNTVTGNPWYDEESFSSWVSFVIRK